MEGNRQAKSGDGYDVITGGSRFLLPLSYFLWYNHHKEGFDELY